MAKKITITSLTRLVNFLIDDRKNFPEDCESGPRILSNPIFDYTQSKKYSIGDLYHKDGNVIKKRNIEFRIHEIRREIEVVKDEIKSYTDSIKDLLKLRPKREYLEEIRNLRDRIKNQRLHIKSLQEDIRNLKKEIRGLKVDWLNEHAGGRDSASKEILDVPEGVNLPMSTEEVEILLKKYAFIIRVEKYTDENGVQWHTKLNKALEKIQKGNTSWEAYKNIAEECGYVNFDEIPKEPFSLLDK